jgi:CRP-like cAMP-binding protein
MKATLSVSSDALATMAPEVMAHAWLGADAREVDDVVLRGAGHGDDWQHNRLLAGLPSFQHERGLARAECVYLRPGQMLHEAGAALQWVYFPINALVSLSMPDRAGAAIEVATVGREGVVGLSILEGDYARSRAVVQVAGKAVRLRASALADEFSHQPQVRGLLLAYAQALVAESMKTALCSGHHSLEQQVARLILLRLDRQQGQVLSMTQEVMAGLLGVRRESVTMAAAKLQHAGFIRYARGHITVLARHGLEDRACDCYHAIRREFDRLLKPQPSA